MTEINPYSKFGYLAIRKESSEGTPLTPNIYLELLSEDIVVNYNIQPVQPIAGKIDMNLRSVKDKISVTGTVTATIDPKNVGYFLANFFGAPTTTAIESGGVYEHVFTPQAIPQTFTFDVKPADNTLVKRYFGVKMNSLEISQADNKMQVVIGINAMKAFTEARVTTATVGATQFHVDQTSGLTTSDVVEFRRRSDPTNVRNTSSIASITSETIFVAGAAATASLSDIITIRKTAHLYTLSKDLIWIGASTYGDGDDIDNTSANDTEDATFTFARDSEDRHSASGKDVINRFPTKILLKGFNANGSFQHYYASPKYSERMRAGEKTALRLESCGQAIDTNSAQAAVLLVGTAAAANAVRCTSSVTSDTSNNLNVTIQNNTVDTLAAAKTGNNILVKRAITDTTKNTGTLVASAINALTGVTAAADGAGTGEVALFSKTNFGSGTNQRGRKSNEVERLKIDLPDTRFTPFGTNNSEDNIVQEEIPFTAYFDSISNFTARVELRNDISSYA